MSKKTSLPQADDEHSDWPGPEPGLSVMQLTDEEIDPEISFSQVGDPGSGVCQMLNPIFVASCRAAFQKVPWSTGQVGHQET